MIKELAFGDRLNEGGSKAKAGGKPLLRTFKNLDMFHVKLAKLNTTLTIVSRGTILKRPYLIKDEAQKNTAV